MIMMVDLLSASVLGCGVVSPVTVSSGNVLASAYNGHIAQVLTLQPSMGCPSKFWGQNSTERNPVAFEKG